MIGFYGMGGGFGHLTRIRAFIRTYRPEAEIRVITANDQAHRFFHQDQIILASETDYQTPESLHSFVSDTISKHDFDKIYVDTFPAGILGELTENVFGKIKINLLARRLRWNQYAPLLSTSNIHFDRVYVLEPLEPDHEAYLKTYSNQIVDAKLDYGSKENLTPERPTDSPLWVICHSTNREELASLVTHAQDVAAIEIAEPHLLILSDQEIDLPPNATHKSHTDPTHWFASADRIFTAGGFNTMQQVLPYISKHVCLPFPRRYDDQFWRARYIKEEHLI
ncbi:MAG: hypothetical protein AAFX87_01855 [Bacteroidota bacterium]